MRKFSVPVSLFLQQDTVIEVTAETEEDALDLVQNMSDMELIRNSSKPIELEVEILDDEIEEIDDDDDEDDDIDIDDEDEEEEDL